MPLNVLNYYALTVAILADCNVEVAFEKLQNKHPESVRHYLTEADDQDIQVFRKQGIVWSEIASYYGVSEQLLFRRLKRFKKKRGEI